MLTQTLVIATLHIIGKKINEEFTLEIQGNDTKFTITAIDKIPAE